MCESKLQSQNISGSHSSQNFQNQDSYTPILEQPLGDTSSLDRSMDILQESLLQYQKSHAESVNRVEEQLSQLVNILRNEETLSYQPLTNSAMPNSIDMTQDSCHFGNQDSISAHPPELVQTSNPIDILASYPFPEIELEHEYDHELQISDSILLPGSIMTPVLSLIHI